MIHELCHFIRSKWWMTLGRFREGTKFFRKAHDIDIHYQRHMTIVMRKHTF